MFNNQSDYTTVAQNMEFLSKNTIQECIEWTPKGDKVRQKHINLGLKVASQKFPEKNSNKMISP